MEGSTEEAVGAKNVQQPVLTSNELPQTEIVTIDVPYQIEKLVDSKIDEVRPSCLMLLQHFWSAFSSFDLNLLATD